MTQHDHGYRDAEIRPYCAKCGKVADRNCPCCNAPFCVEHVHRCDCGKEAAGACLRCARTLCKEHVHTEDNRCKRCEQAYAKKKQFLNTAGFFLLMIPFCWSVSFIASQIKALPRDPSIMDYNVCVLACLATVSGLIVIYRLLAWLQDRDRFLCERPKT